MFKLPWDGTYVRIDQVLTVGKIDDSRYIRFLHNPDVDEENVPPIQVTARIVRRSSTMSILLDELKPIFGLYKNGTHRTWYEGYHCILYRIRTDDQGRVIDEVKLNNFTSDDPILAEQARAIFSFYELLGIPGASEKDIMLKPLTSETYYLTSWDECNITPNASTTVLPDSIINKWFSEESIEATICKLLQIKYTEDVLPRVCTLKSMIEEVIERVDRTHIGVCNVIQQRMSARISTNVLL
uniref:Uncharacterized protein n=1 Tax=viral metagenome TaxID=1070528 RepID=A0A6C0BKQ1_9ZZZZ